MSDDRVLAAFSSYRNQFPARPPNLANMKYDDEIRPINVDEGLMQVTVPPAAHIMVSDKIPKSKKDLCDLHDRKYLWAVAVYGHPFALENGSQRTALQRGRLAHTNLTGGADAHSAGELWFFRDPSTVIINGGSSRYTPRSLEELREVARSLADCGYTVGHMGYDKEANVFRRIVRDEPEWV